MTSTSRTSPADPAPTEAIDPACLEKAKDLLHTLANAVSAMKIFPGEHATVRNFVDQLTGKFAAFLGDYEKLQVGVEEYTFTCEGKTVYTDEVAVKSLPFLLFKDGLQSLFFYRGLDRSEILEFLELVVAEAQKASEDSDIVVALWERDLANIQYYAPDEFLENRILGEARESRFRGHSGQPDDMSSERIEVRVDTSKFSQGRVDLDPGDRGEVEKAAARPDEGEGAPDQDAGPGAEPPGPGPAADERGPISPAAAMDPTLSESELQALEAMVRANRTISQEEEYVDLMVEIVYLDENVANCRAALDTLLEYHFDELQRGRFEVAVLIIQKIHELRRHLAGNAPKAALLDDFLRRTVSPKTVEAVQTLLARKAALDWGSLLAFFRLLGPAALGLAAGLFDAVTDGEARRKIVSFIEETGRDDPGLLAGLADAVRPDLTREIIGILSRMPVRRGVPHLAAFVRSQNKDVKAEAIRVLARTPDEVAGRILSGFLADPDEEVRILATLSLDPGRAGARLQQILREASGREFLAKSSREKEAVLTFLGRTRTTEALGFLGRTLLRSPLIGSTRLLEMRLAAAAGLESMGTPDAVEVLRKGAAGRTRKVREACEAALQRLSRQGSGNG